MTKNMGRADRTIRLLAALAIAVLILAKVLTGTLAIVLIVLAAILVLTTLLGFCPLYVPIKASTKGEDKGGTPRGDG
jgi:fatty acid desaturase